MNLRKQLRESIGGIVIAVLLGGSLALTLCDAMGLAVDVIAVAVPCLVTALACALMTMGVWPLAVTLALLVAGGARRSTLSCRRIRKWRRWCARC